MVANGATRGKHVTEGRGGETGYLLIIDTATRQIWTFPLKSKTLLTTLIDRFLQKNGIGRKRMKITTTPDGMLDRSIRFQQTCESHGYEVESHDTEIDFEYTYAATFHCASVQMAEVNSLLKKFVRQSQSTDTSWKLPVLTNPVKMALLNVHTEH
jgi:hypothetical protein